jgi:hypothetical protein
MNDTEAKTSNDQKLSDSKPDEKLNDEKLNHSRLISHPARAHPMHYSHDSGDSHQATNRALVRFLLLPTCFLTVALLGGLRISADTRAFQFVAPSLITLLLAALAFALLIRARVVVISEWLAGSLAPLTNLADALTLFALFFASAQSFNVVLPERGLLRLLLSFFFLWTLWNNLFSPFDARRLLKSFAALFGFAFIFKHIALASLSISTDDSWLKTLAARLFENATANLIQTERYAAATSYVAFFALLLYFCGLISTYAASDAEMKRQATDQGEAENAG